MHGDPPGCHDLAGVVVGPIQQSRFLSHPKGLELRNTIPETFESRQRCANNAFQGTAKTQFGSFSKRRGPE